MKNTFRFVASLANLCLLLTWVSLPMQTQALGQWPSQQGCSDVQSCYALAMDKEQPKLNREAAIQWLGKAGQPGLMALLRLLDASDADTVLPITGQRFGIEVPAGFVRQLAVRTLGSMGSGAAPAAPTLADVLRQDPVVQVRQTAAIALGQIGANDPSVIQALKEVLKNHDYYVWQGAVFALGQLRPADQEAVDLVREVAGLEPATIERMVPGDVNLGIAIMNARLEAQQALQSH